jgi:hypothetical protein
VKAYWDAPCGSRAEREAFAAMPPIEQLATLLFLARSARGRLARA